MSCLARTLHDNVYSVHIVVENRLLVHSDHAVHIIGCSPYVAFAVGSVQEATQVWVRVLLVLGASVHILTPQLSV
jgi:hypothetical protein